MTFNHLHKLLDASTLEEVWDIHVNKMAEYGFTRLLYGFTRYYSGSSYGDLDDVLTLSNHSKEYLDEYVGKKMFMHGPVLRNLVGLSGGFSWARVAEMARAGRLSDVEKKVWEFNKRMGVTAGYSLAFEGISTRAVGAIGMAARPGMTQEEVDWIWERDGADIILMNRVMHLKTSQMPFPGQRRPLTPRQVEVLEWVADGKTMQDIAQIVGLKVATIEKHLKLAREALDVETTAQAVAKASIMNQIFIIRPNASKSTPDSEN